MNSSLLTAPNIYTSTNLKGVFFLMNLGTRFLGDFFGGFFGEPPPPPKKKSPKQRDNVDRLGRLCFMSDSIR